MRARSGCEKYMKKFGFDWPERMDCDLFPEYGSTKEVCMDPMDANQQQNNKKLTINHNVNLKNRKMNIEESSVNIKETSKQTLLDSICLQPFMKIQSNSPIYNQISTGNITNCIQPCHSIYFTSFQQKFTYFWILIWSLLCLMGSLCTTCTYLIESNRFRYPEKPIIYLSACYLFVSSGYLIRFFSGHEELACNSDGSIKTQIANDSTISCTVTFILTYYFGMASSAWWVIVSLTWLLAAGLKWGTEAISKFSLYFHLFAWCLPFIQTTTILAKSLIDADSLSGVCSVGNLNPHTLRLFVIIPSLVYLSIGIALLIAGFISLFRIRKMIKHQHGDLNKANKLEKLMLRIGVFSILYTVPATCLIACHFYEQYYRQDWERNSLCKRFKSLTLAKEGRTRLSLFEQEEISKYCSIRPDSNGLSQSPEFSVFILKYLMSLIVGVTSGFWIWTSKSLNSWKCFFCKMCFCCTSNDEDLSESNENQDESIKEKPKDEKTKISFFRRLFGTKKSTKDSIVYFQANDELENNPHNFYNQKTSALQQQQQKLLWINNANNNETLNAVYQQTVPVYQKTDSAISLQFNSSNNTVSTQQSYYPTLTHNGNLLTPQSNSQQPNSFQNCHTNKAAGFYFDYSSLSLPTSNASSVMRK